MIGGPPRFTRAATLFPDTTLLRAPRRGRDAGLRPLGHGGRGHQQRERERRAVYMSKHGKAVLIVRVIIVRGTVSIAKVRARGFGAQWRSVSIPSAASKSWSHGRRRAALRSEERRVGKEWVSPCRSRWLSYQ